MFSSPVVLFLSAVALVLGFVWRRTEDNRYACALAGVGVLLLLYVGYQALRPETPAEQMRRKLFAMAAALKANDVEGIFEHVSADFRGPFGSRDALRKRTEIVLAQGELTGVEIWKEQPAVIRFEGPKETATLEFMMKPKGPAIPQEILFRTIAHFVLDPDGEWRLSYFELFRVPGHAPFVPR